MLDWLVEPDRIGLRIVGDLIAPSQSRDYKTGWTVRFITKHCRTDVDETRLNLFLKKNK